VALGEQAPMSSTDDDATYYATLGLAPDATPAQVKARYKELNDAYLKILESSRRRNARTPPQHTPAGGNAQAEQQPKVETRTEPIAVLKEKLAKGTIDRAQFERLTKERYDYLRNRPFSDLSDSEFEERLEWLEDSSQTGRGR